MKDEYRARRKMVTDHLRTVNPKHYRHAVCFGRGDYNHLTLDEVVALAPDAFTCGTMACAAGHIAFGVACNKIAIPVETAGNWHKLAQWLGFSGMNEDSPFMFDVYEIRGRDLEAVTLDDVIQYIETAPFYDHRGDVIE